MKLLALTALLMLAGVATAGTFELSDPAAELREAQQQKDEELARMRQERNAECAIDAEDDSCRCFDPETGEFVELSSEVCRLRAGAFEVESEP